LSSNRALPFRALGVQNIDNHSGFVFGAFNPLVAGCSKGAATVTPLPIRKYYQRLTLAEHAAIDLTLTIFKVKTVMRAVQVSHFALFSTRNAQGAGEFLDRTKHCLLSSLFRFFDDQKISVAKVNYQRCKTDAAMHKSHGFT